MGGEEVRTTKEDGGEWDFYTWISNNLTMLLYILATLWLIKKLINLVRLRFFAYVMHLCTKDEFPQLEEVKKDHFASMAKITSHDPELRKQNAIRVLEIGVGTGVNFAHYPKGSRLVAVDPNHEFKSYFEANKQKFPNIEVEDYIVTTGEKMDMVPDGSVDVVVVTLVLCSIDDTARFLGQIRRVLAPGGKFYFMEHIAEFNLKKHWLRRRMQDVFTYIIPVWPWVFDGCCLDRETLPEIEKAGFSKVEADRYYAPIPHWVFWPEQPNLKGVATK